MTYAYVIGNVIQSEGALPRSARRLDTGQWVLGLREYADQATREACGWFEVDATPRPADAADTTYDRTLELMGNAVPTVVWVARPKTVDELNAETARTNDVTLRQRAEAALDDNRTFLALASPTQAQVLAQVRRLTQQNVGIIRLLLGKLDALD